MARQRQKHLIEPKTLFGLLATLGAIWLIAQLFKNLPNGSGNILLSLLGVVAAAILVSLIIRFLGRVRTRQSLFRKASDAIERHAAALVRRRAQLVRLDPYGKPRSEQWAKEIDYFISQHIQPDLTTSEQAALRRHHAKVTDIIETRVEAAIRDEPAFQVFSDDMTPAEFETFCAEQLRRAGWDARVTMQSRDQGVDVIAQKGSWRVVLQCKLYARPVGNKSVQEAAAARAHERANFGIVVSNNRYTAAAEQLAATNDIKLLHYRDLANLDHLLGLIGPTSVSRRA